MSETVLIFLLAGQRLALPAACVRECLPLPLLWRRPGSPAAVAGFFSLGGHILPAIDLARLLGLRDAGSAADVERDGLYRPLLHVGDVAFLVDRISGFSERGGSVDSPDPWQHDCVQARFLADGDPVALLDPARILLETERAQLAVLTEAARLRSEGWHDAG